MHLPAVTIFSMENIKFAFVTERLRVVKLMVLARFYQLEFFIWYTVFPLVRPV